MRMFKYLYFIVLSITLLATTSCGDDDVKSFDSSKLEGIWTQVFDSRIQDVSVVKYVFYPETSYSGRIELYESNWPDEGSAHMNIFTGMEHDGKTKIFIECDINKLTKSEMVWYKTDSQEEIARFKKDSKIDNN